jgi:hypothetical protein
VEKDNQKYAIKIIKAVEKYIKHAQLEAQILRKINE